MHGRAKDTWWVGPLRLLELAEAPLDRERLEHLGRILLEMGDELLVRSLVQPSLDVVTLDPERVGDLIQRAAVDLLVPPDPDDEATEFPVRRSHPERKEIDMPAMPWRDVS